MLWVPLGLLAVAAALDVRQREIPDGISIALLVWAVAATALGWSGHGWLVMAFGLVIGLGIGALLFSLGGFGGGDVKVLAGLGATLGARDLFAALFYVALAGGVLAAVALWRGKRDIAYVPAIALGLLAFVIVRGWR
jgi:Flp pilus assembly protein protease CpaA